MKDFKSSIKAFIVVTIIVLLVLLWDKFVFELIYNSGLPSWIKYLLLRG